MKAILVGLGGRAKAWLKECRENPDVEIVGCVEPAPANRERAVKEWGIPAGQVHESLDAALKTTQADFVLDVTPPAVHEKVALAAFENGLHVLGEKPLSDDFAAARRVVEAGKKRGLKHMITQNYRYNGQPRTTRRLVAERRCGDIGQLDISFYMPWADLPGSHYVTQPFMFLTDMGIHHFDLIRYVLGREPESAQAVTWNLPWGWHKGDACQIVIFRFPGGLVASHRAVGCTLGKRTSWNADWRLEGSQGTLTWEGEKIFHTLEHRTERKIREEIPLDARGTGGMKALLAEFIAALQEDRAPECNAEDNLKSIAMVFAAVKSARERREVKLSEL